MDVNPERLPCLELFCLWCVTGSYSIRFCFLSRKTNPNGTFSALLFSWTCLFYGYFSVSQLIYAMSFCSLGWIELVHIVGKSCHFRTWKHPELKKNQCNVNSRHLYTYNLFKTWVEFLSNQVLIKDSSSIICRLYFFFFYRIKSLHIFILSSIHSFTK